MSKTVFRKVDQTLLLGLLIALPFGNLLRFDLGGGVAVLALDLILLALVIVKIQTLNIRKISRIGKASILLLGSTALSLLMNITEYTPLQLAIGAAYIVRFGLYLHFFHVLRSQSTAFKKQFTEYLQIAGAICAALGILQYVFFPDLSSLYFQGWDEHVGRSFGTFLDPNFAGAIYALSFFLSIGFMNRRQSQTRIRFYFISALISFIALGLTFSRGSYLMFFVGLAGYSYHAKNLRMFVALFSVFVACLMFLPKSNLGEGTNLLRTASVDARVQEYKEALEIFSENPLFGVGFNTYRYAQEKKDFIYDAFLPLKWTENHAGAGVPNSYLFILATAGIVGVAAFIYLVSLMTRQLKQSAHTYLSSAITASLLGIAVHASFENSLFYPFILFWMLALIAVGIDETPLQKRP